ncbi:hypothetical protein [Lacihabitans soyangensis]|nr:hypothetical protein [Lacihabitans soyangensis]
MVKYTMFYFGIDCNRHVRRSEPSHSWGTTKAPTYTTTRYAAVIY